MRRITFSCHFHLVIILLLNSLAGLIERTAFAKQPSARSPRRSAQATNTVCRSQPGLGLFISPQAPSSPDQPLNVIVVAEKPQKGARLIGNNPRGEQHQLFVQQNSSGPPYWWFAQIKHPAVGIHRFTLLSANGALLACGRRRVEPPKSPTRISPAEPWPIQRKWSRYTENLYSAWIEKLFDAPVGQQVSFTPLHQVLRDPGRNYLYNHLGSNEDGPNPIQAAVVQPDCADMPYFLRAYFAWKLRLPFGYRHCDRGSSLRPARCTQLRTNLSTSESPPVSQSLATRFSNFLRYQVSLVHSGSGRTAPEDHETDFYPVALNRSSLRPGTVYVDPYGHLLVLAKWVSPTSQRGGILYAVDGHPDLSVGRKQFWRGAFLFSDQIKGGAGGFKAFRPLKLHQETIVALTNEEIKASKDYGNFSDQQYRLGIDGFYDEMDRLITPHPLSPLQAYQERLEALFELILERVGSVQAGEDYLHKMKRTIIPMPSGPRIFETKGAWEDYSTPARDMRLLIAIEELRRFPQKILSHPTRFAIPNNQSPLQAKIAMEKLLDSFSHQKSFTYQRSDGSDWKLSLAEVMARQQELEMAYNPNDCPEIRWGAKGSELQTCNRHAPDEQKRLMEIYRKWFANRQRPPLR